MPLLAPPTSRTKRSLLPSAVVALLLALLAWVAGGPAVAQTPASGAVLYEGARLIVGDGSVIEKSAFSVTDGVIRAAGTAGSLTAPEGARRVDLSGMTVMPALVDAHVHMSTEREALITDLKRRAYFGVGAALSMGSDSEGTPLELRAERIPGAARYRSAGLGITRPEPGRREVHWVSSEAEARQAVQAEAVRKVDILKIWVDDRNGQFEKLTPALYGAVIDEAHQRQLRVAAHIFTLEDAKGLVRAGLDVFAHGVRDRDIDEEFVKLIRERPDTVLIPNLPDRGVPTDLAWLAGSIPAAELSQLQAAAPDPAAQQAFGIQARNLAKLAAAGVTIAFGTDGNTPWAPHVELEDMVAAGMTPAQVLVAATRNAARVLRLDDMGTLEAGKSADFIVLRANPLDDIANTRKIAAVYLRGAELNRSAAGE